ncbi:hypothetical protein PQX77_010066 [Marasmius sp. AFHP31]|nr:hypothetical protein PQX77_010066 [Marasmius sp. AFHP31]
MGSSRYLASFVALIAIFASFKFYNDPAVTEITMSGPEMKIFESDEVLKHVKRMQAVATPERPALPSDRGAWAMAWLHLVIWNSWKGAYYYADKFPKEDFANYADYAWSAVEFLEGHHDAEEQALFPALEKKFPGSMEKNEAQHESFLKPVDKILLPVMEHLADELDTLKGSELLKHFTEDELASLNQLTHKAQRGDNHKNLPFILRAGVSNLPPNSPFPPAPAFVTKGLGPWVFYWKYSSLWKYATYPWKPTLPTAVPETSL